MGIQRAIIAMIVVAVASTTATSAFASKIVSWVDENGVTHFSDAGLANGQTNAVSVTTSNQPVRSAPEQVAPKQVAAQQQRTPNVARSASGGSEGKKRGLRGYRSSWARDPERYKNLN